MKLHPFRIESTLSRVPYGIQAALLLFWRIALLPAPGQGTFVYDQQSSTTSGSFPLAAGAIIQHAAPIGQSFTPSLSAVGFIRLELADNNPGNSLGAVLSVDLRMSGISGPILSTAAPVFLPDGFNGPANFLFGAPEAVTPGVTYYFDVNVLGGDQWALLAIGGGEPGGHDPYPGGMEFAHGWPSPLFDLWFREGIVVPEPSSAWLLLLGAAGTVWHRRRNGPAATRWW